MFVKEVMNFVMITIYVWIWKRYIHRLRLLQELKLNSSLMMIALPFSASNQDFIKLSHKMCKQFPKKISMAITLLEITVMEK